MLRKWLVLEWVLLPALCMLGCSESPDGSDAATRPDVAPVAQLAGEPCGAPQIVRFIAGQFVDVGTVTVVNDEEQLCVHIETTGGWAMEETHVAIALLPEEFPQTGSGNPKVGQFALAAEHNPPVTFFEHCIDLATYGYESGEQIYIAAHGAVVLLDAGGQVVQTETAWAEGLPFPGNNWAMYFDYFVQECTPPLPEDLITVAYPNAAEELPCGSYITIVWEIQGECPSAFVVELLHDGEVCETLTPEGEVIYDKYLDWWVRPCSAVGTGGGYAIRVRDPYCVLHDDSDEPFAISGDCPEE